MFSEVRFDKEARQALQQGADILADAVKVTLGPRGRYVVLETDHGSPLITNDGVTIASRIRLEDPFQNMGASLVCEVAGRTNETAGDGTTTAVVLAQAMIKAGLTAAGQGLNPVLLKEGMEAAANQAVRLIRSGARPADAQSTVENVARLSAGSSKMAAIIARALDAAGPRGLVTLKEDNGPDIWLETLPGMELAQGYVSPYVVQNLDTPVVQMNNPRILITDQPVESLQDLLPVLEKLRASRSSLLILAPSFSQEALSTMAMNHARDILHIVPVTAPGAGRERQAGLEDTAVATGGTVCGQAAGIPFQQLELENLGLAKSVEVSREKTVLIEGAGSSDRIAARKKQLTLLADREENPLEKSRLKKRLAALEGATAVIHCGGWTSSQRKEQKLRLEDALNAARCAMESGITAGGGTALAQAAFQLRSTLQEQDPARKKGAEIVCDAMLAPARQIADNAGFDGRIIVEELQRCPAGTGFDAADGTWKNMFDAGLADPAQVSCQALLNATSVSGLFITMEAAIARVPGSSSEPYL